MQMSQFHYGSIKTKQVIACPISLCVGLNSTMVRLKLNRFGKYFEINLSSLNSTMVRLKPTSTELDWWNLFKSQFHYGSIKTLNPADAGFFVIPCLNSTMVRLKLDREKDICIDI